MKFEQIKAGQVIEAGTVSVSEEEIIAFARQFDPQWFHTDSQRATASRWNGLIASGWHTCCLAMKLIVDNVLAGSESFGSPGLTNLSWSNPVRPGDQLRLRIEVSDVRTARSRPTLGIVRWTWRMRNQREAEVLSLEATSLFELSDRSLTSG
ncbi:MAG: MaoC family dehydratase [Burkholderiaceae bacterium]|nr:MaoC family dehydratase [Burkholderiaceae bacterium]